MRNLLKPENEAEALALRNLLLEHGIAAEIRSFHDTAYDGLFQKQYGWGVLRVAEENFEKAEKIIREWRAAAPGEVEWQQKDTK